MWVQLHCFISVLRNKTLLLKGNIQIFLTYHGKLLQDTQWSNKDRINRNRRNIRSRWILLSVLRIDEIETHRRLCSKIKSYVEIRQRHFNQPCLITFYAWHRLWTYWPLNKCLLFGQMGFLKVFVFFSCQEVLTMI